MKSNSDFSQKHLKLKPDELSLKPLKAQVGGHVYMKILNDKYVCKPLNERELQFYQNIPKNLADHVPAFQGTMMGNEDSSGNRREGASSPNGPIRGETSSSRGSSREYLVLENLTNDYKKPCVLDLKMGTRMYGDFATESKRKSQRKKSTKSTSAKLGVRFCGSQRFSVSNDSFEMFDKYVGRHADETELRKLLEQFFTLGCSLRKDVINNVLGEICRMKKSLLDLEEYRFYSSSILIIYEGLLKEEECNSQHFSDAENSMDCGNCKMEAFGSDTCEPTKYRKEELPTCAVTMKIIDFANISFPSMDSDQFMNEGPDRGFLMGLDNLHEILESLVEEEDFTI